MKLYRCKNGHMYDVSRYSTCPYCKSEGLDLEIKEDKINLVEEMEDDDKTMAYWSKDVNIDPVDGWLTCIDGAEKGKDFRIVSERNYCSISYNPKKRIFMITPGQANGLIYIDNEALYDTRELKAYNLIEIGDSKFIFVNLCGENFDWNKEKSKSKKEVL